MGGARGEQGATTVLELAEVRDGEAVLEVAIGTGKQLWSSPAATPAVAR
jgi:hypothetical protein